MSFDDKVKQAFKATSPGWPSAHDQAEGPRQSPPSTLSASWEPVRLTEDAQHVSAPLILGIVILASLAAGWFWYGATNGSSTPPSALWAIVLGGIVSIAALFCLTVGVVKGIAIFLGWLAGRMFWLILIAGGLLVVERTIVGRTQGSWNDTSYRADANCQLCSDIGHRFESAVSHAKLLYSGPSLSRAVTTGDLTCLASRNRLSGSVTTIHSLASTSVVTVKGWQHQLISAVPSRTVRELDLKHQDFIVAIIKPTDIRLVQSNDLLARDATQNRLSGHVTEIQKGHAGACLTMAVGDWKLTSTMTHDALNKLHLTNGEPVTAVFKSADIELQKP